MREQLTTTIQGLVPTAGLMLAASLLLGIAYNSSSPLGVRYTASETKRVSVNVSPPVTIPQTGYFNQTLSMAFEELPGTMPAGAQPVVPVAPTVNPSLAPTAKPGFPELTWAQVKPLVGTSKAILVDARLASAYQAGHIPGAVSLPINFTDAEMAAFKSTYKPDSPLIVYCGSASCHMAHDLAQRLASFHGFTNVKVMPGGYVEYRQAESQTAAAGGK